MSSGLSAEDLLAPMRDACKSPEASLIGVEWEKELVDAHGRRLTFTDPGGVQDTLLALADQHGWAPTNEGENTVALNRGHANITLEPGGQLELGAAPHRDLRAVERDLRQHLAELQSVAGGNLLTTAFTPIQSVTDIEFVPKARYGIMAPYLGARGELAHSMMKGTTSLQVALDFADEVDCGRKLRVGLALTPLVTALCANSPLVAGKPSGMLSFRARTWQQTDPERTGLLRQLLEQEFTFERYAQWLLDVPLMFAWYDGDYRWGDGLTFRQWMTDGLHGFAPDRHAWETHMTSVFPEVRVKSFVELRGADNGTIAQLMATAGLWTGLLYAPAALDRAEALADKLVGGRDELLDAAVTAGLAGRFGGRSLADWMGDALDIAAGGLDDLGRDEGATLDWASERVESGRSPAADVLELRHRLDDDQLVAALSYSPVASIPTIL